MGWAFWCNCHGRSGFFAFSFERPANAKPHTRNILVGILGIIVLAEFYVAFQRTLLLFEGVVRYRQEWLPLPFAIIFLLVPVLLFRNLARAFAAQSRDKKISGGLKALSCVCRPFQKFDNQKAAIRAFFYISIMPVSLGVLQLLRQVGVIDWTVMLVAGCWVVLLTLAWAALVYLNVMPERSSFRIKLIGISLTAVLMILSGISWLIGPTYLAEFNSADRLQSDMGMAFSIRDEGGYLAQPTAMNFDADLGERIENFKNPIRLPFQFSFYSQTYAQLFVGQEGVVGFDAPPRLEDIQFDLGPQPAIFLLSADLHPITGDANSGVFLRTTPDELLITWNKMQLLGEANIYTFQLRLSANGNINLALKDIPEKPVVDIFNPSSIPAVTGIVPQYETRTVARLDQLGAETINGVANQGIVTTYGEDFLAYLDRIYGPVAYFILGSSIFIVLVFSWFFTVNLNNPLQNLLFGVQQILAGKLNTRIPISYADEVGFLAQSFNEMTAAQIELVESLEEKVVKRTAQATELASKSARLEERNHLSQELHDAVSQTLFSANLMADTLPDLWKNDPEKMLDSVNEIRRLNKSALEEMRQLLIEIRSENETSASSSFKVRDIINEFQAVFPLYVSLELTGNHILPNNVQHAFRRILQECLANAAKHSNASSVQVSFDALESQALLSVRDDGDGFDIDDVAHGKLGLQIMRERVAKLGGNIEIQSRPDEGTLVTVIWMA